MARKRMIDPEFWLDEDLAKLSPHARLLYIGLWNICDDNYATLPDRPDWIKAQIFPYESVNTRRLLDELSKQGKIILFKGTDDDNSYWFIKNFFKYQKIDRPSAPKYAQFDDTRVLLDEDSTRARSEVKLSKVKLSKVNVHTPLKKTYSFLEEVTEEDMVEIANHYKIPLTFVKSKYEDMVLWAGEKMGRGKGRNWKLTLQNWVKRDGIKIMERSKGDPTKRSTDARNL